MLEDIARLKVNLSIEVVCMNYATGSNKVSQWHKITGKTDSSSRYLPYQEEKTETLSGGAGEDFSSRGNNPLYKLLFMLFYYSLVNV